MKSPSDAVLRAALGQTQREPLPADIKSQIMQQVYRQSSRPIMATRKPLITGQLWWISGSVLFFILLLIFGLERMHTIRALPFLRGLNQPIFGLTSLVCLSLFVLLLLDTYLKKKWPKFALST
jgi:hypothetical protein